MGIKVFNKVIPMTMKTWRAWLWVWSSILKVLKVTIFQCLYNISKKKLWMEIILESIKIKTSTSWIINLWWKKPDMSNVPKNGSLLNLCNILRKSIATALCSIVMQSIQILYRVPIMSVVPCFWVAVVKNGCGLLDHGTLKYAVSQESELIKWADFFTCWYKFRKSSC